MPTSRSCSKYCSRSTMRSSSSSPIIWRACAGARSAPQVEPGNEHRRSEQRAAERPAEMAAPGHVLLDRHHRAERQHPADIAGADDEHQQHDRPAAADAVEAVVEAELEGAAPWLRPMPMLHDKAVGCAAFVEAMVFEPAELEEAGAG